jgi:RHS repeat-associated protein
MPGEADADKYRYYVRDHQGSVMMMSDKEQNIERYTYDAWGEHIDSATLPDTENKIRYGGARVECFIDAGDELDAIYETGVRHYFPKYGRFLQRDPLTYNKIPRPSNPFSANPYIYAENNPVMKTDLSGLIPQSVRGARMGGTVFFLGTIRPPESLIYDCCASGYAELSDDDIDKQDFFHKAAFWTGRKGRGLVNIGDWKASQGLSGVGLCGLPFKDAQPNQSCSDAATYITPDLACTIVKRCKGGKCGNVIDGDGGGGGNGGGYPWGWSCPAGSKPIDVGYESDPRIEYIGDGLVRFFDSYGNSVVMPQQTGERLMTAIQDYQDALTDFNQTHNMGPVSNIMNSFRIKRTKKEMSCSEMQSWASKHLAKSLALGGNSSLSEYDAYQCQCISDNGFIETPVFMDDWIISEAHAYFFGAQVHQWSILHLYGEDWAIRFDPWLKPGGEVSIVPY